MRRIEITNSAKAILEALSKSDLNKSIQLRLQDISGPVEEKGEMPPHLLEALYNYSLMAQNYSETSSKMAQILSLSPLTKPSEWLVFSTDPNQLFQIRHDLTKYN